MATSKWSVCEKLYAGIIAVTLLVLAVFSAFEVYEANPTYCDVAIFLKPYLLLSVLFGGFWWYFKRSEA